MKGDVTQEVKKTLMFLLEMEFSLMPGSCSQGALFIQALAILVA